VSEPWRYGVAVVDQASMIIGFVEKPPMGEEPGNLINAGVWLFEPELVDAIPPGAVRVEETLFPSLVARGRPVLGYTSTGEWADIGTPATYLALNRSLVGRVPGRRLVHPETSVSEGAVVTDTCVGPGCRIGAGARVEGSVLWEGVTVGEGARVTGSVLANGVVVGEESIVDQCVIGADAMIPPRSVIPPVTSIDAGARYDAWND
jgi:mannose-1-phosphate guanylyltransferase